MGVVGIVVNPVARRAQRGVLALRRAARERGDDVLVAATTPLSSGRDETSHLLRDGATCIVVVGGDGTVRQAAGVLDGSGIPLGLVPIGTANVLAHELGITRLSWQRRIDVALGGLPTPIDLGWAHIAFAERGIDEPFCTMLGVGHDADAISLTSGRWKSGIGWLAYLAWGLTRAAAPPRPVWVSYGARPPTRRQVWSVLVGNVATVPGGVTIWPDARPADAALHVLEARVSRPWQWLKVARKGLIRPHADAPALHYADAARVSIRPERPWAAQLDGDVWTGVSSVDVSLHPHAISIRIGDHR